MRRYARMLNERDTGIEEFLEAIANEDAKFIWSVVDYGDTGECLDEDVAKNFQYAIECAERSYNMFKKKGYDELTACISLHNNRNVDVILVFDGERWSVDY